MTILLWNSKKNLNNYIKLNKTQGISFIERALKINNCKEEDIGLLSLYFFDQITIKTLQNIAEKFQNASEESINKICDDYGLDEYEEIILTDIINKAKENINSNKKDILSENNKSKIDDNCSFNVKQEQMITSNEKQLITKRQICKKEKENQNSEKMNINVLNSIQLLQQEVSILKAKVEMLENLHRGIYFRDISKFYIDFFSKRHNIEGNDTYQRCENLLKMDYNKKKMNKYKKTLIEIAQHYKEGNKMAHLEFFNKNINKKKKIHIAEEILDSYGTFMSFNEDQKELLKNEFDLLKAPFLYFKNL